MKPVFKICKVCFHQSNTRNIMSMPSFRAYFRKGVLWCPVSEDTWKENGKEEIPSTCPYLQEHVICSEEK
jgi:hypothetical protein